MKNLLDTVLSLGKVIIRSRPAGKSICSSPRSPLIVMGNGPSLRETLDAHGDFLKNHDTTAVNFAANTPEFFALRPRHYVLTDPHFFKGDKADPNLAALRSNLAKVDWPMTLHLPVRRSIEGLPPNVKIQHYNMTPGEGIDAVCHPLYSKALATPRPRNVMIPAIMEGIRDGYDEIRIVGADHSWPHTLYVDNQNRVVTVQPHFYEDNTKELDRIAKEYAGRRLHDVLGSMVLAFRSYHQIQNYAQKKGVKIFNCTPESLIDAFPRKPLTED